MKHLGMSTWPRCERARAQAMSSTTGMSSQRYIPYYLAIRREAERKVPAQRGQTIILRREPFSQPGVDYRARKSALKDGFTAVVGGQIGMATGLVRFRQRPEQAAPWLSPA